MNDDYQFKNYLTPVPQMDWIPQIDEDTPAKGGPGGYDNAQAQALLNCIAFIYLRIGGGVQTLEISSDESIEYPGVPIVYWDAGKGRQARLDLSTYSAGAVVSMPTNMEDGDELTLIVTSRTNFLAFDAGFQFAAGVGNTFFNSQASGSSVRALFKATYDQQNGVLICSSVITSAIPI